MSFQDHPKLKLDAEIKSSQTQRRREYAKAALMGLLASGEWSITDGVAKEAFYIADEMMKAETEMKP